MLELLVRIGVNANHFQKYKDLLTPILGNQPLLATCLRELATIDQVCAGTIKL